jgi:hypothetical protein
MIVLAHMVEAVALTWADRVIATSEWTRPSSFRSLSCTPEDISSIRGRSGDDDEGGTGRWPTVVRRVVAPHKGQDILIGALT